MDTHGKAKVTCVQLVALWWPVRCFNYWATWTEMMSEGYICVQPVTFWWPVRYCRLSTNYRLTFLCFVFLAGPVDGDWGPWSHWSKCPKPCGLSPGVLISRHRRCDSPPSQNGGKPCLGNATESLLSCFAACPGGSEVLFGKKTKTEGSGGQMTYVPIPVQTARNSLEFSF